MTERSKTPTLKTHPEAPRAKSGAAPVVKKPQPSLSTAARDSMDDLPTHVFDSGEFPKGDSTTDTAVESGAFAKRQSEDTLVDSAESAARPAPAPARAQTPKPSDDGSFKQEVSTPIQVISMKTPHAAGDRETPPRVIPQVQLRAIADVQKDRPAPQHLGNLAPPRDVSAGRARRAQDVVIWGCVAVIMASVIALAVWFLAR